MKNPFVLPLLLVLSLTVGSGYSSLAQVKSLEFLPKATVVFPGEYESQERGPNTIYSYQSPDSLANFLVVVADLMRTSGLDAETLAMASLEPEFWLQVEQGFMGQLGADAKLENKSSMNVDGVEVLKLDVSRFRPETNTTNYLTAYIFVMDKYSINIAHTSRGGKADPEVRDAFFASLKIE
ncbi:hypothetical protein [Algoriphagus confluentis]|uniref:Uncharacterized protein n=1 Tax=Algoriphagus confluentis TaxID=1697556 RepID=A0ABQ6PIR8_9BACT|nr:hypothetical protein Aconfl_01230 [Algoriphagus confluentis]